MKVSIHCAAALALFPLVSALPAPNAALGELDITHYGRGALKARELRPRQSPSVSLPLTPPSTTSRPTSAAPSSAAESTTPPPPPSSTTSTPPSSTAEPPKTSSTTTPPPNTPTSQSNASPSPTQIVRTTASKTQVASTQDDGQVVTITSEVILSLTDTPTSSAPTNTPSAPASGSSGVSSSTIIGLSVAGGLTALGAIAFIAWKLTRKRFSSFDADEGAINWPDVQKDPAVVAPRAALSAGGGSTTASTVDLVKDPYAVPPLPQNNGGGLGPYRDDSSGFYDPYRGPVPQTFSTPPTSTDGHPQGWAGGEAIPMSTYGSGRTSPGPNYAYGGGIVDPMQRTGTPVQRMATPVQRMATPVGGGGAATFQEIVRAGTPGAVPYRTGTPGYGGYGGR